ncbi:MAG: hypothetical protein LCH81_02185 [Bacteroidetes bacterium]|nr:hypothetical protein [Bacteroidota bacterium]
MKKIVVLMLGVFPAFSPCHAQDAPPAPSSYPPWYKPPGEPYPKELKDINADGLVDTIQSDQSSGSGFSGTFFSITNGKTGEQYTVEPEYCFCSLYSRIDIPPALLKPENAGFKAYLEQHVFSSPRRQDPDASLQWILESRAWQKEISDNLYFDTRIHLGLKWHNLPVEIPSDYYTEYQGEGDTKACFLDYAGRNHYLNWKGDTLQIRYSDDSLRILSTMHGMLLQKNNRYAWIFVTDPEVTGAPDKLRWASIGQVKVVGSWLLMRHHRPVFSDDKFFMVDLQTGKCAGFKIDLPLDMDALMNAPAPEVLQNQVFLRILQAFKNI